MTDFNIFKDILNKLREDEDNTIAKAFTMYVADLLKQNGIEPILTKVETPYSAVEDMNAYQIVSRYGYMFERIDTSEHDIQIISEAIHRLDNAKVNCHEDYIDGIDFSIGVLENMLSQMKRSKFGYTNNSYCTRVTEECTKCNIRSDCQLLAGYMQCQKDKLQKLSNEFEKILEG